MGQLATESPDLQQHGKPPEVKGNKRPGVVGSASDLANEPQEQEVPAALSCDFLVLSCH